MRRLRGGSLRPFDEVARSASQANAANVEPGDVACGGVHFEPGRQGYMKWRELLMGLCDD